MQRVPCRTCGESIHPDTAAKNNGLCMPCKGGYRQNLEAGKRRNEEDLRFRQSEEWKHWLTLVTRAELPGGIKHLTPEERTYFSVSILVKEVDNGGFEQFFFNSSGSLLAYAMDGLLELGATQSAGALDSARNLLFAGAPVPVETEARRNFLRARDSPAELESLDRLFWKDEDKLHERCGEYARRHGLFRGT